MNIREWTLPVYTILIQLSTGTLLALWTIRAIFKPQLGSAALDRISRYPLLVGWITILTAMIGSHLHLSWPTLSLLSVFNVRTSWISREISFTVLYSLAFTLLVAAVWTQRASARVITLLGWATVSLGLTTIYCMARIYMMAIHPAWNTLVTPISFFGAALLLGSISLALMLFLDLKFAELRQTAAAPERRMILQRSLVGLTWTVGVVAAAILGANLLLIARLQHGDEVARTSLQLLLGLYQPLLLLRLGVSLAGVYLLAAAVSGLRRQRRALDTLFTSVYLSCSLLMVGEILGRILFYAMDVRVGW
jgi:anaerobic dimethyl sulfoxide reductase subunit C (anchor subunit)